MEGKKRFRPTLTAYREMESACAKLTRENKTLDSSNKYMEAELKRLRAIIEDYNRELDKLRRDVYHLKNRNFFARLFNIW